MTPSEFTVEMKRISDRGSWSDPERNHGEADALLCRALKEIGYEEGVRIFLEDIKKWYA
ncbi:MAG: hypothetical protein ACREBG_11815 [Pyrinomonadaceae bacterium]